MIKWYNIIERFVALIVSLAIIYFLIHLAIILQELNLEMEQVENTIEALSITLRNSWFF